MKNIEKLNKKYDAIKQKMEKLAEKLKAPLVKELIAGIVILLKKYDQKSVYWQQYTVYFNDGDECTFRVYEPFMIDEEGEYLFEYDYDEGSEERAFLSKVEELINAAPSEIMKMVFGDHVEICVKNDGSHEIEEYTDHD